MSLRFLHDKYVMNIYEAANSTWNEGSCVVVPAFKHRSDIRLSIKETYSEVCIDNLLMECVGVSSLAYEILHRREILYFYKLVWILIVVFLHGWNLMTWNCNFSFKGFLFTITISSPKIMASFLFVLNEIKYPSKSTQIVCTIAIFIEKLYFPWEKNKKTQKGYHFNIKNPFQSFSYINKKKNQWIGHTTK